MRVKERRATDPRYLAMKEAARQLRREASQVAKEHEREEIPWSPRIWKGFAAIVSLHL
jgi:hypothetical protein